jgi:hypothetical protein
VSPVPPAKPTTAAEEPTRPMRAIYAAVILVEVVVLLALWWFQSTFVRG